MARSPGAVAELRQISQSCAAEEAAVTEWRNVRYWVSAEAEWTTDLGAFQTFDRFAMTPRVVALTTPSMPAVPPETRRYISCSR